MLPISFMHKSHSLSSFLIETETKTLPFVDVGSCIFSFLDKKSMIDIICSSKAPFWQIEAYAAIAVTAHLLDVYYTSTIVALIKKRRGFSIQSVEEKFRSRLGLDIKLWSRYFRSQLFGLDFSASQITAYSLTNLLKRAVLNDQKVSPPFCTRIKALNFAKCDIHDETLLFASKLKNLEVLNLTNCRKITKKGWSYLAVMQKLRSLTLNGIVYLSDEDLFKMGRLSNLRSLEVKSCSKITHRGLSHILPLDGLRSANLTHCRAINDVAMSCFKKYSLTSLLLPGCWDIRDSGLLCFVDMLTLREVDIAGCSDITRSCLKKVLLAWCNLEFLSLSSLDLVDNDLLCFISKKLIKLRFLKLWGCRKFNDVGLVKLSALKRLRTLDVRHNKEITLVAIAQLQLSLPRLDLIFTDYSDHE